MAEKTTFDLTDAVARERADQEQVIQEFELRRKAASVVVPTDDVKVRAMLRDMGEPITLFGERELERRTRLRRLLALREGDAAPSAHPGQLVVEQLGIEQTEKFYTEGPQELQAARLAIAHWSLRRAAARISQAKQLAEDSNARAAQRRQHATTLESARHMAQQVSEVGDDRPIAGCQFSPDGTRLATCGWGGILAMWQLSHTCSKVWAVRAHDERCTGVAWHPSAPPGDAPASGGGGGNMDVDTGMQDGSAASQALALATASADMSARLFASSGKLLRKLTGHTDRLARLAFHPMGNHLATASFDMTWRLWDLETGECLLEQEGHSRSVYTVGFHPDGSLAASAGLDATGRLWDCRTGRSTFALEGHVKPILCLDFSPSGYQLITGSEDHTCKVWDLRQRTCVYTMPAHTSLVSSCRYERDSGGAMLITGGYDNLVKVWSGKDFSLVKTLAGHEGRVMAVDVCRSHALGGGPTASSGGVLGAPCVLASVSYDRTVKLWAPEAPPPAFLLGADQDVDML